MRFHRECSLTSQSTLPCTLVHLLQHLFSLQTLMPTAWQNFIRAQIRTARWQGESALNTGAAGFRGWCIKASHGDQRNGEAAIDFQSRQANLLTVAHSVQSAQSSTAEPAVSHATRIRSLARQPSASRFSFSARAPISHSSKLAALGSLACNLSRPAPFQAPSIRLLSYFDKEFVPREDTSVQGLSLDDEFAGGEFC